MKKTLYFLCVLALFLSASEAFSQWDQVRNFKSFKKIDHLRDSIGTIGDARFSKEDIAVWDDSTIIVCNLLEITKINIYTGKSEILFDVGYNSPIFGSYHPRGLDHISTWNDLYACHEWAETGSVESLIIFNKGPYQKFINSDSVKKKVGGAIRIADYKFCGDALVAVAVYKDKAYLISSLDTGATWTKSANPIIKYNKDSVNITSSRFTIVSNNNNGQIGINCRYELWSNYQKQYFFAGTNDFGSHWNLKYFDSVDYEKNAYYTSFVVTDYFPCKTSLLSDTLIGVNNYIDSSKKHHATELCISYNSGTSWKPLQKLPMTYVWQLSNTLNLTNVTQYQRIIIPAYNGVGFTSNAGNTWCLFVDSIVKTIRTVKMIDKYRGIALDDVYSNWAYYLFEIDDDICSPDAFEYSNFANIPGLTLKGNAKPIGDYVRLTESKPFQNGSMIYDKELAFNRSFDAKFGFQLSEGVNGEEDKTSPGADGVALVISKSIPSNEGASGGGIGYNGINDAIAIEFDSFINKDRNDPDYDHVGVFASSKTIENNHGSANCLGTVRIPGELKANISKHNVTVIYEKTDKTLKVFFDSDNEFDTPLISIKDFDIEKYLGGPVGYIGITSSTGTSMQNHYISDFSLCFNDEAVLAVEEPMQQSTTEEYAWPNPASEELKIKIPEKMAGKEVSAKVYDLCGRMFPVKSDCIGGKEMQINISAIPAGFYYVALSDGLEFVTVPFIKN